MSAITFRPVDVLRSLEDEIKAKAEPYEASFEAFSSLGCERGRTGDADMVAQIVREIIGPAPFTSSESDLRIKLSAKSGKPVTIEIASASNGLAVSPETVEKINALQGTVSNLPSGSNALVKVTLPLDEAELETVEPEAVPPEEQASLTGTRILIADDSATNRLVLEEMLSDTGALLVSVNDGREALDAWTCGSFDLLLLDISMPVMDGVTAIREIRAIEASRRIPATPAIAVTANALVNQVADYLVAGFDTHLAKPFRRKDLMHAILTLRG